MVCRGRGRGGGEEGRGIERMLCRGGGRGGCGWGSWGQGQRWGRRKESRGWVCVYAVPGWNEGQQFQSGDEVWVLPVWVEGERERLKEWDAEWVGIGDKEEIEERWNEGDERGGRGVQWSSNHEISEIK
jgi:hypothetical protein